MTDNAVFADNLARAIIEEFGEPLTGDPDYEEFRGWYHFDGDTRYIVHDPTCGVWSSQTDDLVTYVLSTGKFPPGLDSRAVNEIFAFPADEAAEVAEKMAMLHFLPTPALPTQIDRPSQTKPFVHDGWLFSWYFFPEIKRWILAPLKRREFAVPG